MEKIKTTAYLIMQILIILFAGYAIVTGQYISNATALIMGFGFILLYVRIRN